MRGKIELNLGVIENIEGDRAGATKALTRVNMIFVQLGARREAAEVGALLSRPTPARSLTRIDRELPP